MDLDELHTRLVALGEDWAEKEASASLLDESRKSVRAQIAVKYLEEGSAAKAELMAESSEDYINHIKAMVEAKRKANLAKVNYDAAKTWVDLMRSKESTRRAEMQMTR